MSEDKLPDNIVSIPNSEFEQDDISISFTIPAGFEAIREDDVKNNSTIFKMRKIK